MEFCLAGGSAARFFLYRCQYKDHAMHVPFIRVYKSAQDLEEVSTVPLMSASHFKSDLKEAHA